MVFAEAAGQESRVVFDSSTQKSMTLQQQEMIRKCLKRMGVFVEGDIDFDVFGIAKLNQSLLLQEEL